MSDINLPKLIAHRGASAYATENTLRALELVREFDCDWVEFDVQLTADNNLVIVHDENLHRLTNKDLEVAKLSLATIQTIPLQNNINPDETYYIPTLTEWLSLAKQLRLKLNLEIKCNPENRKQTIAAIATLVEQQKLTPSDIILSSFDFDALKICRQKMPDYWIGLNLESWSKTWREQVESIQANSLHINHYSVTEKRVKSVHDAGLKFLTFTVNRKKRAEKLLAMGVDAIFSNYPDLLTSK